jgi:hypothetical protein
MRKSLLLSLMLFVSVLLGVAQSPAVFRHPGVFSSKAELDFLRTKVAARDGSPLVAGYDVLAADSKANLNFTATPYSNVIVKGSGSTPSEDDFRGDAHAAYAHAIRWVATGDVRYRNKSIQILDAWANTFRTISVEAGTGANQPTLESSWALPIWVAAAEIIKTYDTSLSWAGAATFNTFVNRILGYVNGQIASAPNWYISKYLSLMSAGVFLNNQTMYNNGYNGIRGQIDAINVDNGKVPEFDRDFVHSQYVVIGLAQGAEIAHQQGDDALFTRTNGASQPRLLISSEFYVKTLMGTASPNRQGESNWARKSAPYEILLSRYTQLGMNVPQVRTYVLNQNRVENAVENHFVGWLTATHGELPTVTPPPTCEPVSASSNDGNVPASVLDGDLTTRWSADGNGQWIQFCLGASASVKGVQIAFYSGNVRTSTFDVQVSANGQDWTNVATGLVSSGTSLDLQTFSFTPVTGKFVRITGRGNSVNTWNSYTEVKIDTEAVSIPYGQTIWLKGNTGQYVSSKNGAEPMACNATVVQTWNQFLVSDAGNGKVTLQNLSKFVSSENGAQAMTCNRATADAWEQFEWITNADGTISLQGNNGMYVSSENSVAPMTCSRPTAGGWEVFSYGIVSAAATADVAASLKSHPNPTVDRLTYTVPEGTTTHQVVVRDFTGNSVLQQSVGQVQGENTIDTSSWKKGTYYVKVFNGVFSRTFVIVKE